MLFLAIEVRNCHVNIGTQLRSAVAFGAKAVITIGSTKHGCHGSFGASSHIPIIHFFTWDECVIFAKLMDCAVYGVSQIPIKGEKCGNINTHNYNKNAIFVINTSGKLSEKELNLCGHVFSLVLPVGDSEGSDSVYGSVNYEGSIGVCLHYYTSFVHVAAERGFTGEKYNIEWTNDFSDTILDADTNSVVVQAKAQYLAEHPNCNGNDLGDEGLGGLFGFEDGGDDV